MAPYGAFRAHGARNADCNGFLVHRSVSCGLRPQSLDPIGHTLESKISKEEVGFGLQPIGTQEVAQKRSWCEKWECPQILGWHTLSRSCSSFNGHLKGSLSPKWCVPPSLTTTWYVKCLIHVHLILTPRHQNHWPWSH